VLLTSACLFAIGVTGLLLRRNPMAVLMSVETDAQRGQPAAGAAARA
jgi:hypothetical protein